MVRGCGGLAAMLFLLGLLGVCAIQPGGQDAGNRNGSAWAMGDKTDAAKKEAPAGPGVFDVRAYGAVGEGKTLDTDAINRAIEACVKAGGGQVLLPPGEYLSGTVMLRSR